jgi:hypothetical protein
MNLFYILKNKMLTFIHVQNFETFFFDFNKHIFPAQAKQIYEEVYSGIKRKTKEKDLDLIQNKLLDRSLNPKLLDVLII